MTILVESPHFELAHDATCACLYATWQGPHNAPATQANYELICHYVRLTRSTKLLNDAILDQNGWKEVTDWLARNCFQQLATDGMAVIAWVLPRDIEALRDTRKLLALIEQPLVGTFDDSEAAYHWLHQWPKLNKSSAHPTYL